ncbi:MAG: hypothetical protein OXL36_00425 [Bryobacterales bacterium]|nr:hypothetical protein [Bryobacterales bacterium]MDE0294877.1 hypothetical protein [Bryobacterales bacterium]
MKLIRGWENRYTPEATGGLRLSKAALYRAVGEEDGVGDKREGEVRIGVKGEATVTWTSDDRVSLRVPQELQERQDAQMLSQIRDWLAKELDDPELRLEPQGSGRWKLIQNLQLDDAALDSPFLFSLSREPATENDWERLQAALPQRYDTWTITEDVDRLNFEIECGIKRWMGLNEISQHQITRIRGWVSYPYENTPPSQDVDEAVQLTRWFRKRRKYRNQEEYRLAWLLTSPQWENTPDAIEIELTRTGLNLFRPWRPFER